VTAKELLAALTAAGCRPVAEGEDLVFAADPPAELGPYLELLHTGVRAVLTGKRWHGSDRGTGGSSGPFPARGSGPLAFGALDPGALLPPAVGLLTVAGDSRWDRIPPQALLDLPDAFATAVARRPAVG
jgi:hypothetical protein